MASRRPGHGPRPPSGRSTLDNPYDTGLPDGSGTAAPRRILTGVAVAAGAAIAMGGTAAADADDPGSMSFEFDGGAPDPSGGDTFAAEPFATPTPDPSSGAPPDRSPTTGTIPPSADIPSPDPVPGPDPTPAVGQVAAVPAPQPDPGPAPATDAPPPVPGPGISDQLSLTPFETPPDDPTAPGSPADTTAAQIGTTNPDTTAAIDALFFPTTNPSPVGPPPPDPAPDPTTGIRPPPVPGTEIPPPPAHDTTPDPFPTTPLTDLTGSATAGTSTFTPDTGPTPDPAPLPDTPPDLWPAIPDRPAPPTTTGTTEHLPPTPSTDPIGTTHTTSPTAPDPMPGSAVQTPPPPPDGITRPTLHDIPLDPAGPGDPTGTGPVDTPTTAVTDRIPFTDPGPPPHAVDETGQDDDATAAPPSGPDPVDVPSPTAGTAGQVPPAPSIDMSTPDLPAGDPTLDRVEAGVPAETGTTAPSTTDVQGSTGPVDGSTVEDPPWNTPRPGEAGIPPLDVGAAGTGTVQAGLLPWMLDGNVTAFPRIPFPLRATGVHEELLPTTTPWWIGETDLPMTPEAITQIERIDQLADRRQAMNPFGRDLARLVGARFQPTGETGLGPYEYPTAAPDGAPRTGAQLTDLWQRHHDRDNGRAPLTLEGITPQAIDAYLCLAAVRCTGAPPEATIHAAATLATLLDGNGEMSPQGLAEVHDAARLGLRELDTADRIAAALLPGARLATTGRPVQDRLIGLVNDFAHDPTVADLFAFRFLPQAQAAGPDGAPRSDRLPSLPVELGNAGVFPLHLAAWGVGKIPPVELAAMEAAYQETVSVVRGTGYRIPGSPAAPTQPVSPQRRENLDALNSALRAYWKQWRVAPESDATHAAWEGVLDAQLNLELSIRMPTEVPMPRADSPAPPDPAQPGEVARLTSDAQVRVLDALHRNLPSRGTPLSFTHFTAALLGPTRTQNGDQTFQFPAGRPVPGTGAPGRPGASASAAPTDAGALPEPGPAGTSASPPGDPAPTRPRAPGPGVVFAPDAPRWNPDLDPNRANRPEPTDPADTGPTPPERPHLPPLGGFGEGPRPEWWTHTGSPRPDTTGLDMPFTSFPGDTEDLGDTTTPSAPADAATTTPPRRVVTAPIPSRTQIPAGTGRVTDGIALSPALAPAGGVADPTTRTATAPARYGRLPDGTTARVVGEQRLVGTGAVGSVPGRATVLESAAGDRYVIVRPSKQQNPDGTTVVSMPRVSGEVIGRNPAGEVGLVVRLGDGDTGRVTGSEPVTIRTRANVLELNGGGGPDAVPGAVYVEPDPGNARNELVEVFPALRLDGNGVSVRTAMVPAGRQVDLTRPDTLRFTVPAGTPLVRVTQTVRELVPAPTAAVAPVTRTAPVSTPAAPRPLATTAPAPHPRPVTAASPRPGTPPRQVGQQQVAPRQQPATWPAAAPRRPATQPRQPVAQQPVAQQPSLPDRVLEWGRRNIAGPVGDVFDRAMSTAEEISRNTVVDVQPFEGMSELREVRVMNGSWGVYDLLGNLVYVKEGDPPPTVPAWRLRAGPDGLLLPGPAVGGSPVPIRIPVIR